jgi:hypothetical protein
MYWLRIAGFSLHKAINVLYLGLYKPENSMKNLIIALVLIAAASSSSFAWGHKAGDAKSAEHLKTLKSDTPNHYGFEVRKG